jgi:tetrahydromethanopterin S-methyltransferase subunit F
MVNQMFAQNVLPMNLSMVPQVAAVQQMLNAIHAQKMLFAQNAKLIMKSNHRLKMLN